MPGGGAFLRFIILSFYHFLTKKCLPVEGIIMRDMRMCALQKVGQLTQPPATRKRIYATRARHGV